MSDDSIEEINSHTFDNRTITDDDDRQQPSSTMVPDAIRKQLQQTRRSSWMMVDNSPIDQSDMVHRADEVDESTTSNDKVQQSTTIIDDDTKVISPTQSSSIGSQPTSSHQQQHIDIAASIRSRIRQQAKSVVEKTKGAVQLSKRLQRGVTLTRLTPIDDDADVEIALQTYQITSRRFAHTTDRQQQQQQQLPIGEQIAFFTSTNVTPPITSTIDDNANLIHYVRAQMTPINDETRIYRLPTNDNQLQQQQQPALPIDNTYQGLYVPPSNYSNFTRLEQRLRAESQRRWFDANGRLIDVGDHTSLALFAQKADYLDDPADDLIYYVNATLTDRLTLPTINTITFGQQIDIDIGNVHFLHHPLFTIEHVCASRLLLLYQQYIARYHRQLADYYQRRIFALKQTDGKREELDELRMCRDREQTIDRRLVDNLNTAWHQLVDIRRTQSFTSTSLQMITMLINDDDDDRMSATWKQHLIDESSNNQQLPLILLNSNGSITPASNCPMDELERRSAVESTYYMIQIVVNGIVVCHRSAPRSMNAQFCVQFGQIYTLRLIDYPKTIELIINQRQSLTTIEEYRPIARIGLPIDHQYSSYIELQFADDTPTPAGWKNTVGSGTSITLPIDNKVVTPLTNGLISCRVKWPQSHASEDVDNNWRILPSIGTESILPSSTTDNRIVDVQQSFRLIPDELRLIGDIEFARSRRLRLLRLRNDRVSEFRSIRMAACVDADVDVDLLQQYDSRIEKERRGVSAGVGSGVGGVPGIDDRRLAGRRHAVELRRQLSMNRSTSDSDRKSYRVSDVIHEEQLHISTSLFDAIGARFTPVELSRKLKPQRRIDIDDQQMSSTAVRMQQQVPYQLVINVQSSTNLPSRADDSLLEPFVEIVFQSNAVRTSVVTGRNPNWQQLLMLNLQSTTATTISAISNNNNSMDEWQSIVDCIQLNVYDQVVSRLVPVDDRETNTVHEQVERRWLGGIRLPFATLYANGRIDGAIRLTMPPVYLDYLITSSSSSYLKLLMTIEPSLARPITTTTINTTRSNTDDGQLIARALDWQQSMSTVYPHRRIVAVVSDAHGRRVLACRYLRSIQPPINVILPGLLPIDQAALACHIVSLIPLIECDYHQVWTRIDEFLQMLCGSADEHAIMLWCWLRHCAIDCQLLLGSALPDGPQSAFVLCTFVDGRQRLYNASDGCSYDIRDAACPLISVGTLLTADNIYANVQTHEHPSRMRFDTSVRKDWRAMIGNNVTGNIESIQPDTVDYWDTDEGSVVELRAAIEREIKLKFDQWRQQAIPQWNAHASRALRDLLPAMEAGTLTVDEQQTRLHELTAVYRLCGVPIHTAYESVDKILSLIYATGIHLNSNRETQYALGVHVHAYSNNILSCWVYIASLNKL